MPIARIVFIVFAVCLAGCGGADEADEADAESRVSEEPRETVFDPLTETLERAEGVEDTLREQSEELRRRVEEAEGR